MCALGLIHPLTSLAKRSAEDLFGSGNTKAAKADNDGPIADFTKAIELDPKYAKAYANRAVVKSDKGDYEGGIADSTKAVELDPKSGDGYRSRAKAKLKNDFEGAIADSTKAIELNPNDATAYLFRAVAKAKKGDRDGAKADLIKSAEIDSSVIQRFTSALGLPGPPGKR
jgi:tetratricopeptide (TPR) repeat protein